MCGAVVVCLGWFVASVIGRFYMLCVCLCVRLCCVCVSLFCVCVCVCGCVCVRMFVEPFVVLLFMCVRVFAMLWVCLWRWLVG